MHWGSAAFAHSFRAVVRKRRGRLHMPIEEVGHIDRGDWRVVAEGGGKQIAVAIVSTIFHQRSTNAVRGAAMDLALDNSRIDGAAAVIHASVGENFWLKAFSVHFDHRDVYLSCIRQGQV